MADKTSLHISRLIQKAVSSDIKESFTLVLPDLSNTKWDPFHTVSLADRENLEYLGDSVMHLCLNVYIQNIFPKGTPDMYTKISQTLSTNHTFSEMIKKLSPLQTPKVPIHKPKDQADYFEAWIGAHYCSHNFVLKPTLDWVKRTFRDLVLVAYRAYNRYSRAARCTPPASVLGKRSLSEQDASSEVSAKRKKTCDSKRDVGDSSICSKPSCSPQTSREGIHKLKFRKIAPLSQSRLCHDTVGPLTASSVDSNLVPPSPSVSSSPATQFSCQPKYGGISGNNLQQAHTSSAHPLAMSSSVVSNGPSTFKTLLNILGPRPTSASQCLCSILGISFCASCLTAKGGQPLGPIGFKSHIQSTYPSNASASTYLMPRPFYPPPLGDCRSLLPSPRLNMFPRFPSVNPTFSPRTPIILSPPASPIIPYLDDKVSWSIPGRSVENHLLLFGPMAHSSQTFLFPPNSRWLPNAPHFGR